MPLKNFFKKLFITESDNSLDNAGGTCKYNLFTSYMSNQAERLATVYRCILVLSDSIAQLPIYVYEVDKSGNKVKRTDLPIYHLLNENPNERLTSFQWKKLMIESKLRNGAGYTYIVRTRGLVTALHYIPYSQVTVVDTNYIKAPTYRIRGIEGLVKATDMIVFLNYTEDGAVGVSTRDKAVNTLTIAADSDAIAGSYVKSGASKTGILSVADAKREDQLTNIVDKWNKAFNSGDRSYSSVVAVPGNVTFSPININPADAQLIETRKFNVLEICRFYGVHPQKVFDSTNNSQYKSIENIQLSFLTDTLAPILVQLEQELNTKLFKGTNLRCSFDTDEMMKTDKTSQAEYYRKLFDMGIISINELRRKLDFESVDDGDNIFIASTVQPLSTMLQANQPLQVVQLPAEDDNKEDKNKDNKEDDTEKTEE